VDIKHCFVSRWWEGSIVEVDYNQVEVWCAAYLSGDERLLADLVAGVDVHMENAAEMFGVPVHAVTKEQRTIAKRCSFQLQYGSGAANMANKLKIPLAVAARFIATYRRRYPELLRWQLGNIGAVARTRTLVNGTVAGVTNIGQGKLESVTGRTYIFHEVESKYAEGGLSFPPTQIKNYPVQGFATGDLVPTMLGVLYKELRNNQELKNSCLLINTVHDSIMFDVDFSVLEQSCQFIHDVLSSTATVMNERYQLTPPIPFSFPFEIKYGPTWAECNNKWSKTK
jgi:DNA polymerase-1